MTYMSTIAIEHALRSVQDADIDHATQAAHILLATSRRHARRFALAMHSRAARTLDTDLIEHWARVAMHITRLTAPAPARASAHDPR